MHHSAREQQRVEICLGFGSNNSIPVVFPANLVLDPITNAIFINDAGAHAILNFSSGRFVAGANGQGNAPHQLNHPEGLVYDSVSNSFIIANLGGHTIVRWTPGARNGTILYGSAGVTGNSSRLLNAPRGITMDPMGNIYVCDYYNRRVQLFMQGESEGRTILGVNSIASNNLPQLIGPIMAKLDNQLNLLISDLDSGRIVKYLRY